MPWDRDTVVYCSCAALQYVHTHCPCQNCNGKAVTRSTELWHRKAAKLISNCSTHVHVEDTSDNNMEGINDNDMETSFVGDKQVIPHSLVWYPCY